MSEQIRIESGNRWDTLELVRRLPRCRWYLVEREAGQWDVHVEPGSSELLTDVLDVAERWARERHVHSVVHLRDQRIRRVGGTRRWANRTQAVGDPLSIL